MKKTFLKFLYLFFAIIFSFSYGVAEDKAEVEKTTLAKINTKIMAVLFFDVAGGSIKVPDVDYSGKQALNDDGSPKLKTVSIPFLIFILATGAVFFSFWYGFINIRGFKHSIDVIRGKYDREEDHGEISHFRALTSALSATVGLGNIAGVAIAIQIGGPGAVIWMVFTAIFGMSSKFSSCTLSQMYRQINSDGTISGGPMYYLDIGLRQMGKPMRIIGKILGVMYALMVMGGSVGGGNMFQSNQTAAAFIETFNLPESARLYIGIIIAVLVGSVILGGIKRIGSATSKIVPFMCGIYVLAAIYVILVNYKHIPEAFSLILSSAFSKNAAFGGFIGVAVIGVTRAAFSNEAGLGSAAIAHAAAKTEEPVREGIVAMIGPFIDTIIICMMTALVVIVSGVWNDPQYIGIGGSLAGVTLTAHAFSTALPWFPIVLTICVGLFAYSSMIAWCYYGERGWIYLLDHFGGIGLKTVFIFRLVFIVAVVFGAVNSLTDVLDFTDVMILSMALPNILGSIILAPKVRDRLKDYWSRYKSGEMKPVK
ncbi:MAG: alanine:cation symporter family protein [Bdellovibrionales bacterium]|nr:alanine:cation symporter family protein [Bdellovibrionales bacterium]